MSSVIPNELHCDAPEGCYQTLENQAWAKIKAEGWVFLKNGQSFCPSHVPSWYADWKRKKESRS